MEIAVGSRAGDEVWMLVALVTQQIVATREAVDVAATRDSTVECSLRRR